MHDTAYEIGGLVMQTYLPAGQARILEIGAQNVNGTLRDHAPRNAEYTGLDFEEGDGVDIVVSGLTDWNVPDAHFDLVMASSVFEHDKAFWRTFLAMCAKTKPGGHIYISAPSNGTVHRYPQDYWRFYPDCGLALEDWAREEGFEVSLIESFTAEREAEVWNDFCAVFRREPSVAEFRRDFVHEKVRATNILTWRSSVIINPVDDSEDTRLLRATQDEVQRWMHHGEHLRTLHEQDMELRSQQIGDLTQEIARQSERLSAMNDTADAKDEELAELNDRAARLAEELEQLRDETEASAREREQEMRQLAASSDELRSRLAQREEEASQAWAAADERAKERDDLAIKADKARKDLVEANSWVERLALTRTLMERRVAKLEKSLAVLSSDLERARQRNHALDERVAMLSARPAPSRQDDALKDAYEAAKVALDETRTQLGSLQAELADKRQAADNAELQAAYAAAQSDLAESRGCLSKATTELTELRRRQKADAANLKASAQVPVEPNQSGECWSQLQDCKDRLDESQARQQESESEVVILSDLLTSAQDRMAQLESDNEWLRQAGAFLLEGQGKWWWRFMPLAWRTEKRNRKLRARGLFDAEAYIARYPDVVSSGQEPFRHFVHHGLAEHRRYN